MLDHLPVLNACTLGVGSRLLIYDKLPIVFFILGHDFMAYGHDMYVKMNGRASLDCATTLVNNAHVQGVRDFIFPKGY